MHKFDIKAKLIARSENSEPKGLSWLVIVLLLVLLSFAVLYFGGNNQYQATANLKTDRTANRAPRTYSVFYTSGVFSPTNLRIRTGDLVEFQNKDFLPIRIVSDIRDKSQIFGFENSGDIAPDGVFSFTFSSPGIFNYHNEKNPNEAGTVIVK